MAGRPKRRERLAQAGQLEVVSRHGAGCECQHCRGFQPDNSVGRRFEADNVAAGTHLAYVCEAHLSENPRVRERFEWILATQPIFDSSDEGAAWRLALVYERIDRSAAALDHADHDLANAPLAAYRDGADFLARLREDHRAWLRLASKLEEELGRSRASRSKLAADVARARESVVVALQREARERERA